MMEYGSGYITHVVELIEARIREGPTEGLLNSDTVDALDVVNHGLSFARHPRALELWRETLWERQLSDDTRQAVIEMFEYLNSAIARGETGAIAEICDCLTVFLTPEARLAMERPHNRTGKHLTDVIHNPPARAAMECNVSGSVSGVNNSLCIPAPTPDTQILLDRRGTTVDLAWLELESGMQVLDLGCGTGGITRQIARAIAPGRVLGLDASPEQLSFAAKQAVADGLSNMDFVLGNAGNPNLPADAFDLVVSHTLLMYLPDPIQALVRQREIVQPGGLVVALSEGDWGTFAHFPHSDAIDHALEALVAQIRLVGGDPEVGRKLPSIFHAAGFSDVQITEAATDMMVTTGAELAKGSWLMPLRGILEQAAQVGVIDAGEVEEALAGIYRWTEQPGSLLIWPRAVRAKARR